MTRVVATPAPGTPLELAARLDDFAHQVLARLAQFGADESEVPAIRRIYPADIEQADGGLPAYPLQPAGQSRNAWETKPARMR